MSWNKVKDAMVELCFNYNCGDNTMHGVGIDVLDIVVVFDTNISMVVKGYI